MFLQKSHASDHKTEQAFILQHDIGFVDIYLKIRGSSVSVFLITSIRFEVWLRSFRKKIAIFFVPKSY